AYATSGPGPLPSVRPTAALLAQVHIPRKLHYVWFGGNTMPDGMKATIEHWRSVMPEYEICEWNEGNLDVASHPWMARMCREGKYAFASDYARLLVLHEHGGIYLDTDVKVIKSLAPFIEEQCFWSFEFDHFLSTAIIGCRPGHPIAKALLTLYDDRKCEIVNNTLVTEYFIEAYPEFRLNNRDQIVGDDIRILPKEYFILPTYQKEKGYSLHLANNQWKPGVPRKFRPGKFVRSIIGDVLFFKLYNIQMGWRSNLPGMEKARRKK
ncbi:MAG: glycosyltransferase, partial [Flavobacteriales bacterium]